MKIQVRAGLIACLCLIAASPGATPATAVINEFHEKPEDTHELEEFIELYNPGDSDLSMTGWKLTDAVSFTFPASTLPAHGYLVIALDPTAMKTRYGVTALGPWSGKLSGGETINLKDASGTVRDTVTYKAGFPWPSAIDNEGNSAELINPGLDNNLAGSWRASNGLPTPGAVNSTYVDLSKAPPHIEQVSNSPTQPISGQAVTVTAKITDPDGIGAVSLSYQLVDPGAYIRTSDAAYQTNWTSIPMSDDGKNGDAQAGDSIYTAVLPAGLQTNRRLVRYRITFSDALGNIGTVPYSDDSQKNFAYFVYDGLPSYRGSLRPGTEPVQTYSASTLSSVPVYTLIANSTDVLNSQYMPAYDTVRMTGTLVYDGVVYDNIQFRNRGQSSTYYSGKNKWKFYFNPSRDFVPKDNLGKPYLETWGNFAANACATPWVPSQRGMAGVGESVSLKAYQLAGSPSPSSHYYQFRAVLTADENPAAGTTVQNPFFQGGADGQYEGDFWGLYMAIEPIKGNFLDERGLPDGNIYSLDATAPEPEHLLPGFPEDSSDYNSFVSTIANTSPTEDWWRANLDLDSYYTFHAINRLLGNVDLREGDNYYMYRRSSDNRWVVIPWDLDMMFIARSHSTTVVDGHYYAGIIEAHKALLENPALALEFRNRAREVLDLMASDSTANGGQIGQLIDEFTQIVAPTGTTDNLANADAAKWNMNPLTAGVDGVHSGQSNHKGNFFYTPMVDPRLGGDWTRWLRSPDFTGVANHQDMMQFLRDYTTNAWPGTETWQVNNGNQLGYGYQYLLSESADSDIPSKPVITYTGDDSYPVAALSFSASTFSDPQGPTNYAATQWRVAEISAPGLTGYVAGQPRKYEIESGWSLTTTGTTLELPENVTTEGKTYRARVRYQDTTGRWSHWSDPVQFETGVETNTLIHYWNFNGPSSTTSTSADSFLTPTLGNGALWIDLGSSLTAEYLADTGKGFAGANAQNGDPAGTHLRLNNPLGTTINFFLPTTGYDHISTSVEIRRSSTGTAAELETWSYTIDGVFYYPITTFSADADEPQILKIDFQDIPGVADNPLFGLKVSFAKGTGGTAGNHRFDNFTVSGYPIAGSYASWAKTVFTQAQQMDSTISGQDADPDGDGLSNFMEFALGTQPLAKDANGTTFTWSSTTTAMSSTTATGAGTYPALRFRRPENTSGVLYELRVSNDLINWIPLPWTQVSATSLGNGLEEVVVRDILPMQRQHRFLALRAVSVP